ncbi:MAG TPA: SAM-dependent methyltransferase [Pyrinomonadaceae bacterium]|nr:SAM-dependent methyltransferase [Pyrinomonadaceae bacterium]
MNYESVIHCFRNSVTLCHYCQQFFGSTLMKRDRASKTAEYMAFFRALESARPPSQRLFNDPLAISFLRPSLRLLTHFSRVPFAGNIIPFLIDTRWVKGARPTGVARTVVIDERLTEALKQGVKQVVILGAGYDTRAFRIEGIEQACVFEIDHPLTSKAKQEHLRKQLGRLPDRVRFLAADFNQQSLEQVVVNTDFDAGLKTFFIWEGVTNYLSAEAVDSGFRAMRKLATDVSIIFTYVDKAVIEKSDTFEGTAELKKVLTEANEHWTFGFDPSELREYLAQRGFRLIEDVGSVEFRTRYLGNDPRQLRGYEFYRVALAHGC